LHPVSAGALLGPLIAGLNSSGDVGCDCQHHGVFCGSSLTGAGLLDKAASIPSAIRSSLKDHLKNTQVQWPGSAEERYGQVSGSTSRVNDG
jgi:hypothetical protein